jgi:antitoxin component YwqK of YwqJK toxin-antitoxin module
MSILHLSQRNLTTIHPFKRYITKKLKSMKSLTLIVSSIGIMMMLCLSNLHAQSSSFSNDTINRTDAANLKQGWWVTLDANGQQVVEKGKYKDGKKDGIWTSYFPNGKTKHVITFKNGIANGPANFFYEDGQLWESGNWMIDHWVGKYSFFYPDGQKQYEWNYNNLGKRQGPQNYFHPNGKVKYAGNWENGKTVGSLKVFDDSGKLTEERVYTDGKYEKTIDKQLNAIQSSAPSSQSILQFTGTGNHTVYDLSGKIEKKGYFKNGLLMDGEQYLYNTDGVLITKLIFVNGNLKQTIQIKQK